MNPYVLLGYSSAVLLLTAIGAINLYSVLPADDGLPAGSVLPSLVAVLGAMGGAIHGLASLAYHLGKRDYQAGWTGFYLSRPFLGIGMAVTTFLVLVSGIGGFKVREPLPLMAWALLAGLYSQAALDKLKEIFATLFKTAAGGAGSPPRGGGPAPGGPGGVPVPPPSAPLAAAPQPAGAGGGAQQAGPP